MPLRHPLSNVRSRLGVRPLRRVAALAALVLDVLSLTVLVALLLSEPLFALLVLGVAVAFLASSFAALLSTKVTRVVLTITAVSLAVLEVGLIVIWPAARGFGGWAVPLVLVVLGAGFALGRYALKAPPAQLPNPDTRPRGRAERRSVLFINPNSGGGKAKTFDLAGLAEELGVRPVILRHGDDLEALARKAAHDGAEVLGMAGGDGSQACVLGIAAEHGLPFVCIPSGTRNHFALDLGLDRRDPRLAMAAFVESQSRRIDYATVNGRVFVNNVALGVYAAIVEQDGYREAKVQTTLDLLPRLAESGGPWFDLRYDVPGAGPQTSSTLVLVSNNSYELAGGSIQRGRIDGGTLGVIALNTETLSDLVGLTLAAAAGRPDVARALWRWETPDFSVGSPHDEVVAGIDGETVHLTPPVEFAVVPAGVEVLVPPGSRMGLEEQQSGGGARLLGLFEVAFQPSDDAA